MYVHGAKGFPFVEDDLPMFKFHIKLNEHQAKTETGFVEEILVG